MSGPGLGIGLNTFESVLREGIFTGSGRRVEPRWTPAEKIARDTLERMDSLGDSASRAADAVTFGLSGQEPPLVWARAYNQVAGDGPMGEVARQGLNEISQHGASGESRELAGSALRATGSLSAAHSNVARRACLSQFARGLTGPVGVAMATLGSHMISSLIAHESAGAGLPVEAMAAVGQGVAREIASREQDQGLRHRAQTLLDLSLEVPAGVASAHVTSVGLSALSAQRDEKQMLADIGRGLLYDSYVTGFPETQEDRDLVQAGRETMRVLAEDHHSNVARAAYQSSLALSPFEAGPLLQEAFLTLSK